MMRLLLDPARPRTSPSRSLGAEAARETNGGECRFFRPVLMSGGHVLSGYCTVPNRTRFGLDFSPPAFSTCLGRDHFECPFYGDEISRERRRSRGQDGGNISETTSTL